MKYPVTSLYVLKVGKGEDEKWFICKKDAISKIYTDLFCGKKFEVADLEIEFFSLCSYYESLDLNLDTLKLSKKEIITEYIDIIEYFQNELANDLVGNVYFDTKDYTMNEYYAANELLVAKMRRMISEIDDNCQPKLETTKKRYLFIKSEEGYREVFTGFTAHKKVTHFNVPYIVDIKKLTELRPETMDRIYQKLELLELSDEINRVNDKVTGEQKAKKKY